MSFSTGVLRATNAAATAPATAAGPVVPHKWRRYPPQSFFSVLARAPFATVPGTLPTRAEASVRDFAEGARRNYRINNSMLFSAGIDPIALMNECVDNIAEKIISEVANELDDALEDVASALIEAI
jgi:hypothetical protein